MKVNQKNLCTYYMFSNIIILFYFVFCIRNPLNSMTKFTLSITKIYENILNYV